MKFSDVNYFSTLECKLILLKKDFLINLISQLNKLWPPSHSSSNHKITNLNHRNVNYPLGFISKSRHPRAVFHSLKTFSIYLTLQSEEHWGMIHRVTILQFHVCFSNSLQISDMIRGGKMMYLDDFHQKQTFSQQLTKHFSFYSHED